LISECGAEYTGIERGVKRRFTSRQEGITRKNDVVDQKKLGGTAGIPCCFYSTCYLSERYVYLYKIALDII
jgi:hypothetical protein